MNLRLCPVNPLHGEFMGWDTFCQHLFTLHTPLDEPDQARYDRVERILQRKDHVCSVDPEHSFPTRGALDAHLRIIHGVEPATGRPAVPAVVPKVTVDPLTDAMWRLSSGDRTAARRILSGLGASERRAYLAQMTELINILWEDQ